MDARDIEKLRVSTCDDFGTATPKPMSACLNVDSRRKAVPPSICKKLQISYALCKKVAVSFDGQIFRATDAEVEEALKIERDAPSSCSAAIYVKAVQEIRRRHAIARARLRGSG